MLTALRTALERGGSAVASRSYHASAAALEQIVVQVPSMGDSISEGGIVEWCVPIGGYVSTTNSKCQL